MAPCRIVRGVIARQSQLMQELFSGATSFDAVLLQGRLAATMLLTTLMCGVVKCCSVERYHCLKMKLLLASALRAARSSARLWIALLHIRCPSPRYSSIPVATDNKPEPRCRRASSSARAVRQSLLSKAQGVWVGTPRSRRLWLKLCVP